ncbi:MAG: 50S ribosomal protein L22 [Bacteroidetes bacterium CG12_big_fil_rev_8_21_14_0_65_60_17]|nr:MAG: 50S ribosomal protein L22 [Bacteroidetes bacterium CG12_big_fil_rev_8_21_14_0_65_60_17]
MESRAVRKHIRSSAKKMRPVVNVVRGKTVPEALDALNFLPQKVTRIVKLTILSAVHNMLDQNQDERIDEQELLIKEIRVDQGPAFKRFRPVSRGRAHPILKRTCHLTVVVANPTAVEIPVEEA